MKTTSRFALVAAAGLMMGAWSLSAKAADLGGDCCADLEERVAELEATTVRKGNRKVSLELSGQVNRALVAWDDGRDSDAYIVDNDFSSTRFRLRGTGQIAPTWKAGFYIEVAVTDANSTAVSQFDDEGLSASAAGNTEDNRLQIRQANVFVESATLGRVTIGQQSPATDDLVLINLGGSLSDVGQYYNTNFTVRQSGPAATSNTGITWGNLIRGSTFADSARGDFVRYDTPSIYGFIFSAAWGENDVWDVAARFQKEWNSVRISAGVGYYYNGDPYSSNQQNSGAAFNNSSTPCSTGAAGTGVSCDPRGFNPGSQAQTKFDKIIGSGSILHVPTGLYVYGAGGTITTSEASVGVRDVDSDFWLVQGGITKRFFDVGATTVYGEYGEYNDIGRGFAAQSGSTRGVNAIALGANSTITSSEVTRYGFGVTQAFDGAALELYAQYHHYEADVSVGTVADVNAGRRGVRLNTEDLDLVVTGARIKF